jgi:AcrR family transcriptional regulator
VAQTQHERKAETRARLLAAAATLFAEQGVDAVSVDAVAEAAGRTSGAVYSHFGSKQGLLLALLDSWKDSVLTVLLAEVAVTESPLGQLTAVWENVAGTDDAEAGSWSLLEQELSLRAARDSEVAEVLRTRNLEARRFSARQLAGWAAAAGAAPVADPDELAILVKALLTGLAMQRRLEPGSVGDDLAVRGLAALLGMPDHDPVPDRPKRSTRSRPAASAVSAASAASAVTALPLSAPSSVDSIP